jgi:hypothetical protein
VPCGGLLSGAADGDEIVPYCFFRIPQNPGEEEGERDVVKGVSESILKANDAADNPLVRRHPIVTVLTVPADATYADSEPTPFVVVNVRNPNFSLETQAQRQQFVCDAAEAILTAVGDGVEPDRIYINLGGLWGIGDKAYTVAGFQEAAAAAAA